MKVKEVLKLVGYFLDDDEIVKSKTLNKTAEQSNTNMQMPSDEENQEILGQGGSSEDQDTGEDEDLSQDDSEQVVEKINKLLKCFNLVYQDLTRDYMPLITEEVVNFENEKFDYKNLSKVLRDIVKIEDQNQAIPFRCFPTFVKASASKANIVYSYQPDELFVFSEIDDFAGKIDERTLAYGVVMEYCFLSSLSDEATIWENRYISCLQSALKKKSNIIMPKRRWI